MVELELRAARSKAPVWIQAGHPDNSVTVYLGYGRERSGRAGTGAGFDVYPLRKTPRFGSPPAEVTKTGGTYKLASTQGYQTMDTPDGDTRPLVRDATSRNIARNRSSRRKKSRPEKLYALSRLRL